MGMIVSTVVFNNYYISSDTNKVSLYQYDEENKTLSDPKLYDYKIKKTTHNI